MTAAIATIVFLSAAWLAVVSIAVALDGHLAKIRSALSGKTDPVLAPVEARMTVRYQPARQPRLRVRQELRAAA